jgi:L-rhamnose mutarotase
LKTIYGCNIRNYTIFLKDNMLFAYFEYIGDDFAADMVKMAADPVTQDWWAIMEPMQQPILLVSPIFRRGRAELHLAAVPGG